MITTVKNLRVGDKIRIVVECEVIGNIPVAYRLNGKTDIRSLMFVGDKNSPFSGQNGYVTIAANDTLELYSRPFIMWMRLKFWFKELMRSRRALPSGS